MDSKQSLPNTVEVIIRGLDRASWGTVKAAANLRGMKVAEFAQEVLLIEAMKVIKEHGAAAA